ncbi:MAG: DUF1284 domain-containing protein [Thermoleophilia bacterium]
MGGIRLRPHHLLCIQGFRGQGYSPTFIANMARLKDMLSGNPETRVEIVSSADEICSFCPHLDGGACTRPGMKVDEIDRSVMARLGLEAGMTGSWSQFTEGIRQKIDPAALSNVCHECSWIDLGFCAKGIAGLSAAINRD